MSSVVPKGWGEIELNQFVDVGRGYAFKSSDYTSYGNPIVRVTNISNSNGLDLMNNVVLLDDSRTKEFESYLLKDDDFLLVMVGATVGKYAKVNTKGRLMFLNQNMWRLSVHDERTNSQRFAIYGLQKVVEEFLGTMQGSAREFLTQKEFGKAPVLTPPLPEQKKIASILTSVDEVIENTQKQIDKLQDLKKATMNELLTKGIGHTEFKDSELGRIPKSWEVQPLRGLSTKVGSGVTPRGGSSVYQDHGIIFIRSQNVHFDGLMLDDVAYISEQIHAGMKGSMVCGGDVLLNITGASIGRCTVVPNDFPEGNVNQHVCIIRPINSLYNKFLGIWLSSDYGQDQIMRFQAGGNREGLNFEQIRSIKIPVPSIQEQEKASEVVDSIQVSISEVQSKLHQTQSLKKSLMQDLLTGKVRVTVN